MKLLFYENQKNKSLILGNVHLAFDLKGYLKKITLLIILIINKVQILNFIINLKKLINKVQEYYDHPVKSRLIVHYFFYVKNFQ